MKNKENLSKKLKVNKRINQNPSVAISKKDRGITLIALIVTIVVLIILAVVSINIIVGEGGIISQAERARDYQANAEASDLAIMDNLDEQIANAIAEPPVPQAPVAGTSATKPETWTNAQVSAIADGEGGVVPLPDNFYYVGGEKNTGIVISDKANDVMNPTAETSGNQFVWVPVDDVAFGNMFAEGPVALSGTKEDTTTYGENGITSSYYSKLRPKSGDSFTVATVTNGAYSSTNAIREPDLITSYDKNQTYWSKAGYSSAKAMAEGFVEDYTNMRASIERYKGFYIGRYELTGSVASPTVKPGAVLTSGSNQAGNWYGLYKACRDVGTGKNNVTSTMIWGCQWDETMNWLSTCGYNVDTDSSSWGNYSDYNTKNGYTEEDEEYIAVAGGLQNTGYSEYWSANNIYDLAGNYYDYTQEANNSDLRVSRGRSLPRFRLYLSSLRPLQLLSGRRRQLRFL